LNHTMLALWFDEIAFCMLTNPNLQFPQGVEYCWNKWPNRRGFHSLPTEGVSAEDFNGHCCTLEMPLIDRGFNQGLGFITSHIDFLYPCLTLTLNYLQAFKGYEDPYTQPVLNIVRRLVKQQRCLVFIGDSLTAQTLNAFLAELIRESALANITERAFRIPVVEQEPFSRLKTKKHFQHYQWQNISIMKFTYAKHDASETNMRQFIEETVKENCFDSNARGALIIANIGLHIQKLSIVDLANRMNSFLSYLNELRKLALINQVAFIETFPQHFDSIDGTFNNWQKPDSSMTSDTLKKLTLRPNSWDSVHPLYHCKPNERNINLIENSIVQSIINTNYNNNDNKIGFIELFKYFNHFPRMHYGYCKEDVRTVLLDCSHLCSFNPTMWMPIWAQLETFLFSGSIDL